MTTAPLTFRRYEDGDREAVWAVFAATTAQLGFTHGPGDIGQALMAALEGKARQRGIAVLQLDTSQSQVAAQALYHRCGYRDVGHVILGGVECIVYEKHLSPGRSGINHA